jgi:hypothetical protein
VQTTVTLTIQTVPAVLFVTMVRVVLAAVLNRGAVTLTNAVDSAVQHSGLVIQIAHAQHICMWRFLQDYLPVTAELYHTVLKIATDLPTGREWDITNLLTD